MRLLLDMGLSPGTAEYLRRRGYDAVHLRDQNLHRATDEQIVRKASDEQRIIVTFDLDFTRLLALQRLVQPSVVLFRLEYFTTDQVNERLVTELHAHESELDRGAIVVIDSRRVRVRTLPIWSTD